MAGAAVASMAWAQRGVPSDWQAAMNRVRAESIRAHLSFLASDVLEGRGTPSRGLDVAAEYIASQFRRAGIDPIYQPLNLREAAVDFEGFQGVVYDNGRELHIGGVPVSRDGIQVEREPLLPAVSAAIPAKDAVVVFRGEIGDRPKDLLRQLGALEAKLMIVVDPSGRLVRAATRIATVPEGQEPKVSEGRFLFVPAFPENLAPDARITVKAKPMAIRPVPARNVAGVFRGSDPMLRDTYVVVSAHYDHEGMRPFGSGDRIYNGANDNASGVTGMLEMAASFAALPERPKRSVIFAAFAAEEDGMLGSQEFVKHSPVPIEKIVANVNFEHLGRPDADGTSYLRKGTITGFDFSTIATTLTAAARTMGVELLKHEKFSDPYFKASDNLSFAEVGIPAHTVSNGFIFPEYHAVGDQWEKIDSENMTGLVRALMLGVLTLADDPRAPQWNETNEKTLEYRQAGKP
jgi:hypothetical protein